MNRRILLGLALQSLSIVSALVAQPLQSVVPAEPASSTSHSTSESENASFLANNSFSIDASMTQADQFNSNLNSSTTGYRCDGSRFGYNLGLQSCLQALGLMPMSGDSQLSFGSRDFPFNFDVGLPQRYLSCRFVEFQHS